VDAPAAFACELLQLVGGLGRPAGCVDLPPVGRVLAGEFEAEAAIRAGDEYGVGFFGHLSQYLRGFFTTYKAGGISPAGWVG
jgi:hypothetical protein